VNALGEVSRRDSFDFWTAVRSVVGVDGARLALPCSWAQDRTPARVNPESSRGRHFPLTVSPNPVAPRTLNARQFARAGLVLTNHGTQPAAVVCVEARCPCVSAKQVPVRIGSAETRDVVLCFDQSDEPDFIGGPSADVMGDAESGVITFRVRIDMEIRKKEGEAASVPRLATTGDCWP
jgi:hypothetical protein